MQKMVLTNVFAQMENANGKLTLEKNILNLICVSPLSEFVAICYEMHHRVLSFSILMCCVLQYNKLGNFREILH